jgi:hypothetical protein
MEQEKDYNSLLASVTPPKMLWDTLLDSKVASEARETFFAQVRYSFEQEFSYGALAAALSLRRITSPPKEGRTLVDISDELMIDSAVHHPSPIAFALQTSEHGGPVVRFGLIPIHKFGNSALKALKQADEAFSTITFRG